MAPRVGLLLSLCYISLQFTVCVGVNETTSEAVSTDYVTTEVGSTSQLIVGSGKVTQVVPTQSVQESSQPTENNTPAHYYDATQLQVAEHEHTSHGENNTYVGITMSIERVTYTEETVSASATTDTNIYSNQTADTVVPGIQTWLKWLDKLQLVLSIVGYITNNLTFITFIRNGDMFSPAICLLLKHQALVDSWICGMGTILLLQPPMWTTGNEYFDAAVCYLWHGQAPFWGAILLSVWNLASIAVERYVAVCRPFQHGQFKRRLSQYSIIAMYIANPIITIPSFVQVRFEDGACLSEFIIQGPLGEKLFYAYCVVWFLAVYLVPVTAYVYLYGRVVWSLYRRKNSTDMSRSKVIDTAQTTITKTAITLTAIFLFAIGFDAWAYLLGYTGVVEYEFGSVKQKVGVFFSVFNSFVNPFVYLSLMPSFRLSLRKTFSCCLRRNTETDMSTEFSDMSNTMASRI